MKEKKAKKINIIIPILFGLLAIILIFAAFYIIAKFYYSQYPPIGNDFYHSFNLINFFEDNLTWPHQSWRYIWHFGGPSIIAYPWLNFYLVQPLIKSFGMFQGSMFYFLGSLFLYGLVLYYLFLRLSKSYLLSIGLSVSVIWSASSWRLISAGSLTLTVNQFLLALALLFIVVYLRNKNRKYLFLSALVSGLSVWSQTASGFPFVIPIVGLVILGWWSDKEKFFKIKSKLIDFFLYLFISLLVSSFYVYYTVINLLSSRGGFEFFDWMKEEAFSSIFTKTNPALFILLAVFVLVVVVMRKISSAKYLLAFLLAFVYLLLFNLATVNGFNPFGSSLAPAENWFIFTLLIAVFVAILWQGVEASLKKHLKQWLRYAISIAALLILLTPFGFWQAKDLIEDFEETNFICGVEKEEAVHKALVENDFSGLEDNFPEWFLRDDMNWRFFSLSWCVELWWNSFNKMPISGGYDTLLTDKINRNYINWTNEIFNGTMEQREIDKEIIKNNMLFHIDWFAGRFIEKIGDFTYLDDEEIVKLDNQPEGFRVFEFQDGISSPIARPTNVPTVLIVSTQEGYDTVLRILAQENLNSRFIIPVQGPEFVEDLVNYDLSHFDAIFLYDYHYKKEKNFKAYPEKPWEKLLNYVESGGALFLETGSEVKESDIKNLPSSGLPEVFPITNTKRAELGTDWEIKVSDKLMMGSVNPDAFDDLIYQDAAWKLSFTQEDELKPWARAVFSQQGKPVLVAGNLEKGKVIWSGLNFPYHIKSYNNIEEGKLFRNIMDYLVGIEEEKAMPFEIKRERSEQISLKADDFKGVLIKESFYPGWQVRQGGEKLEKIYKAGFGFMYIPAENSQEVTIKYAGETKYWLMFIISLATIGFVILYLFLGNKLNALFNKSFKLDKIKKKTKSWWEKDEE